MNANPHSQRPMTHTATPLLQGSLATFAAGCTTFHVGASPRIITQYITVKQSLTCLQPRRCVFSQVGKRADAKLTRWQRQTNQFMSYHWVSRMSGAPDGQANLPTKRNRYAYARAMQHAHGGSVPAFQNARPTRAAFSAKASAPMPSTNVLASTPFFVSPLCVCFVALETVYISTDI